MKVIIIGGLHHNTLGVIRAIGEKKVSPKKIKLIIIGENLPMRNILSSSRYVYKRNITYINKNEDIIPLLLPVRITVNEKPNIICCSDGSSMQIMSHRNDLEEFYYIPSINLNVSDVFDKEKQTEIAASFGLKVPKSSVLTNKTIGEWNTYPCIIKPITSVSGAGKADIAICNSRQQLQERLKYTKAYTVQVQEYISKSLEFQLIGCSLNSGETVIIPGYTEILRQPKNTNTGYLRYSPIEKLDVEIDKIKSYVKYIGYSGLFSLEFLRTEDGKDYYLEMNMRNDGNAYCVTVAGVNLPYIWILYNKTGEIPKNETTVIRKSLLWIPDLIDMKIGIAELGVFGWFKQLLLADGHSIFNSKDMLPGFVILANLIRSVFLKFGKKIFIC